MAWHRSLRPSEYVLKDGSKIADVQCALGACFGLSRATRSPLPNPISIERAHLPILASNSYVVCEKTDGVRYSLVMGVYSASKQPYAVLIDRSLCMYEIRVIAEESYFLRGGSVFDGELVWALSSDAEKSVKSVPHSNNAFAFHVQGQSGAPDASARLTYIIFDAYRVRGDLLTQENFLTRMEAVNMCFGINSEEVLPVPEDNTPGYLQGASAATTGSNTVAQDVHWKRCAAELANDGKIVCLNPMMKSKPCMPFYMLDTVLRALKTLQHRTDGLIFTPVNSPVVRGTHEKCFKYKTCHSIDFLLRVRSVEENNQSFWTKQLFYMNTDPKASAMYVPATMCTCRALLGSVPEHRQRFTVAQQSETATIACRDGTALFRIAEEEKLLPFLHSCAKRGVPFAEYVVECDCEIQEEFIVDFDRSRVIYIVDTYILHCRPEKDVPNNKRTVERTLVNLDEQIEVGELLDIARDIDPDVYQ